MQAVALKKALNWPDRFRRLVLLLVPLFLLILIFNKASLTVIAAIIAIALLYAYGREHIWLLVALSIPSLVFGEAVYISITDTWVYEARIAEIFFFLAAAVYALDIYLNSKYETIKFDTISFLLSAYLLLTLASFAYVFDIRLFVFGIKTAVFGFLAYFLAINLLDNRFKIISFLYGVCAAITALSVQIFAKFYQMGFSSKFFFERNTITIPIGPIATTAAILAMLVLVAVGFYFQLRKENDKYAPFVLAVISLGSTAVFLTLGKAAIAGFIIGLAYIFVKIKKSRLPVALFVLWFIVIAYFALNPFLTGLFERIQLTLVDANTKFRLLEYETGWEIIQGHWLVGVGAGQQLYYFKKLLNYETAQLVNNYFFQSLIDLGIIGLSVFLLLFFRIIGLARKNAGAFTCLRYGFIAALACAAINGLFEVTIFALPYAICFWLMLGVFKNLTENKPWPNKTPLIPLYQGGDE